VDYDLLNNGKILGLCAAFLKDKMIKSNPNKPIIVVR
jgi:hypothetical protein